VSKTGTGSGTTTYNANGSFDYYLTTATNGSWSIEVLP
jgi:hypothetical protein